MSYRENIEEIKIPKYTKGQEVFNTISHVLGIPLAFIILFIGLCRLVVRAIDIATFLGLLVFVITIVDVYFVSSLYHGTDCKVFNKKLFLAKITNNNDKHFYDEFIETQLFQQFTQNVINSDIDYFNNKIAEWYPRIYL